jgi:glycosyltransferase involved in cell wall biosynthesis
MFCYHFPPVSSAGTQRNVGFVRWLPSFGWKPVLLTVRVAKNKFERGGEPLPPQVEIHRSPEWNLHGLLVLLTGALNRICDILRVKRRSGFFFEWCLPDPQIAWLTTLRGIYLSRDAECMYASCAPFSAALSACLVKKVTGKPVIVDFRDAWALNPHANYGAPQRRIIGVLERWVLRTCDALILNTPGAERLYRRRYPEHASKMSCIPNGFDRLNLAGTDVPPGKFTIMHVGDFYRSRNPARLLQALARIGNRDIEFVHVGPPFDGYDDFKDRVSITVIDRVAHAEALRLMRSASVLYLCQGWEQGIADYIAVASKTYEYLATGLPILADCPPGDNADIVREYASRAWVLTSANAAEIEAAVVEAYEARSTRSPDVSQRFVETFRRDRLTGLLAGILESIVPGTSQTVSFYSSPPLTGDTEDRTLSR